ncbi:MAG TPA: SUMF1/EgtB/PvdO family nonheme iron enzyme [Nitrospinaceae bacterium]|nr:SUMF1/EgtB/PvdO family nonheme iron enzyme [Nitrospinaceae bacterium]HJO00665.1 SUMF1/EgtB/PvdO family nonheme iron enzyme [Nitrospinaceae bacterium]|tara:strand:- start:5983 stop:7314 length:1332 start_codon:yes stop_codon:yes gene_type:complete
MAKLLGPFIASTSLLFILLSGAVNFAEASEASDLLESGTQAFTSGKYREAEGFFQKALKIEPDNFLATRDLAKIKIELGNFESAIALLDNLLKLPIAKGRNILVFIEGDPEPHEAELVDETVMTIDKSADQENAEFSKFLKEDAMGPVPHYRVNLSKSGVMKLLPKSKTRIKYHGIPAATRDRVIALKMTAQKKLVAAFPGEPEEEMVLIESGCFQMGSDRGDPDEQPVHEVCISPFKIGKYEVQQKNFRKVMKTNPSQHIGANLPVDNVSWEEARDYCKKMGLRLPKEAEWEYAARAGTKTEFYWGNRVTGKEGNFCDRECELSTREPRVTDGFKNTSPVGSYPANPFGLYDMAGNVNEWVQDWKEVEKNYYLLSPKNDPLGPRPELDTCSGAECVGAISITIKMFRGGSWNQRVVEMRSANRRQAHFQLHADGVGFRCASD